MADDVLRAAAAKWLDELAQYIIPDAGPHDRPGYIAEYNEVAAALGQGSWEDPDEEETLVCPNCDEELVSDDPKYCPVCDKSQEDLGL